VARRLLVAGCGDLGVRLAGRMHGWRIAGLRRRPAELPGHIEPLAGDLSRDDGLSGVARDWDALVYTATPGQRTEAGYRRIYVEALARLLERVRAGRVIFVSSTAVYGQRHGEWVDEQSLTAPGAFNGRVLLEAEAIARAAGAIVVRFSGIYGPGRDFLLRKVRAGGVRCRREPPIWTNRIHAEDCAGVLAHLLSLQHPAALYVASDAGPAPRFEVLDWLAQRLGAPRPEDDPQDQSGQGKRVSARALFDSGLRLDYPDYQSGYEEIIECA